MISIIIPAYNAEKTIAKSVRSACEQTFTDIEVVVIDDGSRDATYDVCCELKKEFPVLQVYSKPNGGVSSARNYGLEQAKGEYIVFCDADDEMHKDMCMKLFSALQQKDVDMVICGYESSALNGERRGYCHGLKNGTYLIQTCFSQLVVKGFVHPLWNKIFIKSRIQNYFDETMSMGEDLKFVINYLGTDGVVCLIDEILYTYDISVEGSLTKKWDIIFESGLPNYKLLVDYLTELNIKTEDLNDYFIALIWGQVVGCCKSAKSPSEIKEILKQYYIPVRNSMIRNLKGITYKKKVMRVIMLFPIGVMSCLCRMIG
ncbi:MAG: glycosyltransferase family 2 protein [Lachnospiraceae bacterium]|nr:glycosyltransferase family 2 protein [Lachnospiraceae bacterium]